MRIMLAVPASEVAATLAQVLDDPVVGESAWTGLRYLHGQFGRRRSPGVVMAVRALTGSLPDTTIEKVTVAYVGELERTTAGAPRAQGL